MTPPPRRKFFQIHLSTAIVLMFVAGDLMYFNIVGRGPIRQQSPNDDISVTSYGWPYRSIEFAKCNDRDFSKWFYDYDKMIFNSMIALLVLFVVWQICERVIRKKG